LKRRKSKHNSKLRDETQNQHNFIGKLQNHEHVIEKPIFQIEFQKCRWRCTQVNLSGRDERLLSGGDECLLSGGYGNGGDKWK
jgi:hypothetical protein